MLKKCRERRVDAQFAVESTRQSTHRDRWQVAQIQLQILIMQLEKKNAQMKGVWMYRTVSKCFVESLPFPQQTAVVASFRPLRLLYHSHLSSDVEDRS